MPSVNEAFPSSYLKAADLQGRNALVTMSHAVFETIGTDKKLVLFFQGKEKGLVLNKTNANNIAIAYGDNTEDWQGQQVVLFEAMVDYQGKTVPAIRVRMPQAKDRPQGGAARPSSADMVPDRKPAMAPAGAGAMDDEIPFAPEVR